MSLLADRASDERLSRRLASGEAAAFDELYRRYAHRLSAYAAGLLGDGTAGEDVAQVALLNAYQALRRGQRPERVRPWLYRIAHNEAVDMLSRRRELLRELERDERTAPDDGSSVRGALLDALASLPERQRRVYLLREVQGLRVGEISAELALTAQQVEQALFAARNRLAEQLVFGERLSCDAAQRLAEGPLTGLERRALRRHFRACPNCKQSEAGRRLAAPTSLLWLPLDLLRGRLTDLAAAGSAPVALKAGAVVAAATVAAGVAVTPDVIRRQASPAPPREATRQAARKETATGSSRPRALEPVATVPTERAAALVANRWSARRRHETAPRPVPAPVATTASAAPIREAAAPEAPTREARSPSPPRAGGGRDASTTDSRASDAPAAHGADRAESATGPAETGTSTGETDTSSTESTATTATSPSEAGTTTTTTESDPSTTQTTAGATTTSQDATTTTPDTTTTTPDTTTPDSSSGGD